MNVYFCPDCGKTCMSPTFTPDQIKDKHQCTEESASLTPKDTEDTGD